MTLLGVVLPNGGLATGAAKSAALAEEWQDTFAHAAPKVPALQQVLAVPSAFDFSNIPPPEPKHFARFLRGVPNSAPGLDGLPFAAWRELGDLGAKQLWAVHGWLAQGLSMARILQLRAAGLHPQGLNA